jgi:hypothetical protein
MSDYFDLPFIIIETLSGQCYLKQRFNEKIKAWSNNYVTHRL